MVVLGVDLRASSKRASTVVALNQQSSIAFMDSFSKDDELAQIATANQRSFIAIGAPLCLPLGLCCLEATCACDFAIPARKGRLLELELSRMGISCFFTNKGSIIRKLIYRGITLSNELKALGHNVIEVYPHATKIILFGDRVPPKNSAKSLAFMQDQLPNLVSGLEPHLATLERHRCDALINAYTALLHSNDGTDLLGTSQEGLLALPRLIH